MDEKNVTEVKEFILLGFSGDLVLQRVLFFIFLVIYVISLLGNITLISLICGDSRLHTHVFLHRKPVISGSLVFVCLCPQNPDNVHLRRQKHLLCWMPGSVLLLRWVGLQ